MVEAARHRGVELLHDFAVSDEEVCFVISSSWREVHFTQRIRRIFSEAGSRRVAGSIIDRTDVGFAGRSREELIVGWLERFEDEIEAWAAIDDMKLNGIEEHHVKTTWADGLLPEHIEHLREILQ